MWCHDGKVSLASFVSGIITTLFTSILTLSLFSLELNSPQNVALCFIGPIGTYAVFCVFAYFVTSTSDYAVIFFKLILRRSIETNIFSKWNIFNTEYVLFHHWP